MASLPQPQLYIILGIVGTAAAMVSSHLSRANEGAFKPVGKFWITICVLIAAVMAEIPIAWILGDQVAKSWDAFSKSGTTLLSEEFAVLVRTVFHLITTVGLFVLLIIWCYAIARKNNEADETP